MEYVMYAPKADFCREQEVNWRKFVVRQRGRPHGKGFLKPNCVAVAVLEYVCIETNRQM